MSGTVGSPLTLGGLGQTARKFFEILDALKCVLETPDTLFLCMHTVHAQYMSMNIVMNVSVTD